MEVTAQSGQEDRLVRKQTHEDWQNMMEAAKLAYGYDGRIWFDGSYPVSPAEADAIIAKMEAAS